LKGLRDRALLLLGFAGAFRRSELVALDCEDIEESEAGVRIAIRHSKTDQEGQGATIAIVRGSIACPVAALKAWREAAGITTGPVFRSIRKGGKIGARLTAQSVADIVKANAERVGLDPDIDRLLRESGGDGQIDVPGRGWGWAFALRYQNTLAGCLIVSAADPPGPTHILLLTILAQQTGAALACAEMHHRDAGWSGQLAEANEKLGFRRTGQVVDGEIIFELAP